LIGSSADLELGSTTPGPSVDFANCAKDDGARKQLISAGTYEWQTGWESLNQSSRQSDARDMQNSHVAVAVAGFAEFDSWKRNQLTARPSA
jgi:hypothetical protein